MLPVAQLASCLGVYGVSALVASVSAAAALSVGDPVAAGSRCGRSDRVAVVLLIVTVWGSVRVVATPS